MAPTDLWLGGPLHRQQPNQPPTHPLARSLRYSALQPPYPIRVYPQFPKVFPDLRANYRRVTEPYASGITTPMTCMANSDPNSSGLPQDQRALLYMTFVKDPE